MFSNFLTELKSVDAQSERLTHAFDAVTPGGVVLIMRGVGDRYPTIYARVQSLAAQAGLRPLEVQEEFAPPAAPDPIGAVIKRVYQAVWARLDELGHAQTDGLAKLPDVWDPSAPYVTSSLALRAFRRDVRHG